MKRTTLLCALLAVVLVGALAPPAECGSKWGLGIHYRKTLGDISDNADWDENALGFIGSYQFGLAFLTVEADLEWVPDYGGTGKDLFEPQAWGLIGGFLYGGAGIGIGHYDGDWLDNPFYALRLGVNVSLFGIGLDVFGSYRFQKIDDLQGLDGDDLNSMTFGAIARFGG